MAKKIVEMEIEKVTMELPDTKTLRFKWPADYDVPCKTGQFITYDEKKNALSNLFARMGNAMDVPMENFGDSTGIPMSELFG